MVYSNIGIIILAAGLGTRMKSQKAKVLHDVCGKPMIQHVVETATQVVGPNVVVVVGHQADELESLLSPDFDLRFALQSEQLGTGHAALCALPQIQAGVEHVVILCGDVPLIRANTIKSLIEDHLRHQRDVSLLAVKLDKPKGYGRVLFGEGEALCGIVEEADADDAQKMIRTINTGIYAVQRSFLGDALPQIGSENAQGEIYLTDIIEIGYRQHKKMGAVIGDDSSEIIGVNSLEDLQVAENILKKITNEIS